MSQAHDQNDNSFFICVVAFIALFCLVPMLYAGKASIVNGALLSLAKLQLRIFTPFSEEAQTAWAHISALDPGAITWEEMSAVLSYTGKWMRWPLALILALCGVLSIFMGRTAELIRRFNMDTLLRNNAEVFPCLAPVVGRGGYLLSPESYDSGLWRVARNPIQFALENGLLFSPDGIKYGNEDALRRGLAYADTKAYGNGVLNRHEALEVFTRQLGSALNSGTARLSPVRATLVALFLAYSAGRKKECVEMLDQISRSYTEKDGECSCPVLDDAKFQERIAAMNEEYAHILKEKDIERHSAFEIPWIISVLNRARKKGVLASSQFLWLRPMDRPMWYALNQCGGRAAWPEAMGPWAHYMAEEKAGKKLEAPHVSGAVKSLEHALDAQGWLVASDSQDGPVEDWLPEYDANNDKNLQSEFF